MINRYALIIPDVHEKLAVLEMIIAQNPDAFEIICEGDYWDTFDYTCDYEWFDLLDFIKIKSKDPRYKMLLGNHDVHYISPSEQYCCSGFDPNKRDFIKRYTVFDDWRNFHFMLHRNIAGVDWVFTHAGMSPNHLPPYFEFTTELITKFNTDIFDKLAVSVPDSMLVAGRARGGRYTVPGITWTDFNQEFTPIPGINQIVGHTYGARPKFHETPTNICLDSDLNYVMKLDLDTGEYEICPVEI